MSEVKLIITCRADELAKTLAEALGALAAPAVAPIYEQTPEDAAIEPAIPEERNQIKAELDKRGIEYNPKSPTKNLRDLLIVDQESNSGPSETPSEPSGDEPSTSTDIESGGSEESPVKEHTKEEVRVALLDYVAACGSEGQTKARELLKEVGGVDRLAKLEPEKYGAVMRAITEATQ